MLTDLLTLLRNRERPRTLGRWLKVWGKRAYHGIGLLRLLLRPHALRRKGATVGRLVVLGKAKIDGRFGNFSIGDESSLGRCEIMLHDEVRIGRRVVINDGAALLTASHHLNRSDWAPKKAPITLDDYAWVATGAILLPGVRVGRGAVVGAGAVVREDVPDHGVVAGNPAVLMEIRRTPGLQYAPALLNAPFEAWTGPVSVGPLPGDDPCS